MMAMVGFEEVFEVSVRETLSKVLGELVWKAISFYFDPKTMSRDPEAFSGVLGRLFGTNARVLEKLIGEALLSKTGVPENKRGAADFRSFVRTAKAQLMSASSNFAQATS
jgi:hypothetical protein